MRCFTIPNDWPVLVVEDDPKRIIWFKHRIPHAVLVSTAEDALQTFATSQFRVAFLDHDLTFADAAFPDARTTSGVRVAAFLNRMGFKGLVVIHSVNERGARKMKTHLPSAHVAPFGTFEVNCK